MMERNPELTFPAGRLEGERLFEHHAWLCSLAEDLVSDASHGEDVVQETFLAALTSKGERPRDLVPWLKAVLRNSVRQSHRAQQRRRRRERRAARPERVLPAAQLAVEQEELQAHLERHIARLREPYRSTVVLHYFRELTLEEIARRQGLAAATVRTRLRRALAKLRRQMRSRKHGFWASVLFGALRPRDATAVVRSASVRLGARCTPVPLGSGLSIGGIMQVGVKSVVLSSVVSAALVGTVSGLYLLNRASDEGQPSLQGSALASAPANQPPSAPTRLTTKPGPHAQRAATAASVVSRTDDRSPSDQVSPERSPEIVNSAAETGEERVSDTVLALRRDYSELQRLFSSGGNGWKLVGDNIARIREVIVQSEEGFEEFLALVDRERDGLFLEAVLHHLPLKSGSPFQKEIVEDEELHEELWVRFEEEPDAYRRRSLLRFFCYQPKLSREKMAAFGDIVRRDESPLVRSISMDAISSANFPKEAWPALCDVAEHDSEESLRAWAVRGLAAADSDRADEIYRAAFSSDSEAIRAAAVGAHSSGGPPPEAVGGDYTSYLVGEFRSATTKEYRQALIERLLDVSPITLLDEAGRALRDEVDRQVKRQYRRAVEVARARLEKRDG